MILPLLYFRMYKNDVELTLRVMFNLGGTFSFLLLLIKVAYSK